MCLVTRALQAGLGVLRVQGVWAESDLPEESPRGQPALCHQAGPCSLHPQLCPLALGCGRPLEVGEGCLGGGWFPGSTECLPLEGFRCSPVGLPALRWVWPCLRTGARKLPAQPLQKPHGGLAGFLL